MVAESVESLSQRAREAIEQREWEKARQLYLQALGLRSDSPDVHHGLATVCFQMKDLPSAAYHFKEVTRLDPLRAVAYINLGAVYNLLDQLDEAVPALRRGIQLDTHRAEGFYNLGLVYRRKKQTDLAIQAYCEAIRVNPRMADAHYNLANLYLEKSQFSRAVAHYKAAQELRPNWEKAQDGLEQAEAALEAEHEAAQQAAGTHAPTPKPVEKPVPAPSLDPNRMVDPNVHGMLLTTLHKATIDSENQGRQFLEILEKKIEPAIKELSSCLLYSSKSSVTELDQCVHNFEQAIQTMQNLQHNLQTSMERIRVIGDRLIKS